MADEYIKRLSVYRAFDDGCKECRDSCSEFDGFLPDCEECLLRSVGKQIKEIPIEDVAPVVYCKDCKYAYYTMYCHEIEYSCENENGLNRDVPAYGYCYWGKRMDGET